METTLAHLFPEMTANITTPVLTLIYLFVLDWRLALLSLAVFPIAFVFMMSVMGGYAKDYQGAVQATNEMSISMIEYINGIEVIKAFNQGRTSYARLAEKVRANAQYYFDWMRRSQLGMSMAYAFFPAQMLTVLPFGWLFYAHGTLSIGTFLTVIILSLGMSGPIVAAFNFVDTLAQVGTTVHEVDGILHAPEQTHAEAPVQFENHVIEVRDVHFGYHDDQEILHGVSLSIPQHSMTALVGPSGSGKSTLAKLIAGFWDVSSGSITMGGHDLKDIPLTELYAQAAFVSQDNYLFDDTVRENIRMGRRDATDAEVEAAAQAAGCGSFIAELEHGFDTMVGGAVTASISKMYQTHAGYFMAANRRIAIADRMKRVPMGFFNDNSLGQLSGVCTTVIGSIETMVPIVMVNILSGLISTLVFTAVILIFDWRIGLIAAAGILAYLGVVSAMEKRSAAIADGTQRAQTELIEAVLEHIQGMSVVKSFNLTGKGDGKLQNALEASRESSLEVEQVMTPFTAAQEAVLQIASVGMMLAAVLLRAGGSMTLPDALMVILVSFLVFSQVKLFGMGVSMQHLAGAAIDRTE